MNNAIETASIVQEKVKRYSNTNLAPEQKQQSNTNIQWHGDPNLVNVVKFNKDAHLMNLSIFEINSAAKSLKKQRDIYIKDTCIPKINQIK